MSDIRDKLVEKQAMDDMEKNAIIKNIDFIGCNPAVRVEGRYNKGGMVMGGPKYHMKGTNKSEISLSNALEILNCENRSDWIDENWHSICEDNNIFTSFSPSTNVYVDLKVYIKFDIEYYNKNRISVFDEVNLRNQNYSNLINLGVGTDIKISYQTNDSVTIETSDGKRDYDIYSNEIDSYDMNNYNIIIDYLSSPDVWTRGYFGEFEERDNSLIVPLNISNNSYKLDFKEPFNDDNKIWELSNLFNYNDPWNLQNEMFTYSIHSSRRKYFRKEFIRIKNPQVNEEASMYEKLKNIISI